MSGHRIATGGLGRSPRAWWAIPALFAGLACAGDGSDGGDTPPPPEPAGAPAVVIDGRFDEWADVPERRFEEGAEPRAVAVRSDARAVYLALRFDEASNVQGRDAPLLLVLDADGDSTTGPSAFGLPGVDLIVSLSRLRKEGGAEDGVAAWRPDPGAPERAVPGSALLPADLGLWFEPRTAAGRVELRLERGTGDGAWLAAGSFAARAVALDPSGKVRGETPAFRSDLAPIGDATGRPGAALAALRRSAGTDLRVVQWNIAGRLGTDLEPARRILAAVDPDLVLLDEVSAAMDTATARTLLPPGGSWSLHLGSSGGRQRGIVAARGDVVRAPAFDTVRYAAADGGAFPEGLLAATDVRAGVPATGAWVRLGERRLLVVALDLVCCGNSAGSPNDRVRRLEATAIGRAAHRALVSSEGEGALAAIVAGDFNLVGSVEPLRIAGRGLGVDGADLVEADALQLDGASTATWVDPTTPFPPGQLDYVLYPPGLLEPLRGFVLETDDLSDAALAAAGLSRRDSDRASDHRPVVVDFAWR